MLTALHLWDMANLNIGVVARSLTLAAAASVGMGSTLAAQRPQAESRRSMSSPSAGDGGEVLTAVARVRVPSKAFNATREAYIWVPAGEVVTATRYPVLVFPDAEEKGQFRAALANIQFLIDRQLVPPLIVVGVPYFANRRHELTPAATGSTKELFPAAGGADDNLRFIAEELLPWVDAHYPTVPTRLLAGHSLGGLFAVYAMMARPELFRAVISMSAPMWWNDGATSEAIARSIAGDTVRRRTLFLTSGGIESQMDTSVTRFATRITALVASVHNGKLVFERARYPHDAHDMTPLPSLVDGLRMIFQPMVVPLDSVAEAIPDRPPLDSAHIADIVQTLESRFAAAAADLGVPAVFPEAPLNALGVYAIRANHLALGVKLLRENRDRYPHSSNAHESLAEAFAAAGDTAASVAEFRTAIAIAADTLRTTTSIISRTRERGITAAAKAQLQSMHRPAP
jgi:predicted alpha/beta superfamily hydrolase